MKLDTMRKLRAGVFTLGLATLSLTMTASAQTTSNSNSPNTNPVQTTRVVERDNDTNWGWLGLLGLVGLAGLLKKPKQVVVDRTSDTTNRANVYSDKRA
jgi:hypothetical protein